MTETTGHTLEARVAAAYDRLPDRLRHAADFIVANPLEVATRSLRSVAEASGVSPASLSRLARALGLSGYEDIRTLARARIAPAATGFSERARRIGRGGDMLHRQAAACVANIEALAGLIPPGAVAAAAADLARARSVTVFGALGSAGIAEYLCYQASFIADNWRLAGATAASDAARLAPGEALVLVTKTPYARRAVALGRAARTAGACLLVITDSHACPVVSLADHAFIVPSETPQFFSSYAATLVLLEALMAELVARAPKAAAARISQIEAQNRALGEYPDIE